ncbi:MAG: helix-turn-helix transcriptional regulator [Bacteroidales bacterium]
MTLGEHIMLLRKQKGLSQAALGKQIGTSGDIIGRYERNIMTPSIDVIMKISDTIGVSIDYLVGKTNLELDKTTLKRLEEISTLSEENKSFLFRMIDMALRDLKTGQAYTNN